MEVRHGLLKPTKIILHRPLSLLHDLLGSLLLSCCQSLERFFIFCHGCILIGVVVERKLSSTEDVGRGRQLKTPKTNQNPTASAPRCLLGPLRCRFFRSFQGVNHKCGSVLFGFIEPSALNHFAPIWRFEKFGYGHHGAAGL